MPIGPAPCPSSFRSSGPASTGQGRASWRRCSEELTKDWTREESLSKEEEGRKEEAKKEEGRNEGRKERRKGEEKNLLIRLVN